MPEPIVISSLDDSRVDVFRNVRDADLRGRDDLFMAESELVLRRLVKTPERLHSILLSHEKLARLGDALRDLPAPIPVYVTDLSMMHQIAAFHIHRGVLAAGIRPSSDDLSLDRALRRFGDLDPTQKVTLIAAEGITNVDNMGALFRNAAAFGVDGVVLDPTCCDPLYRKAIRVSMGHVLAIPYAVSQDWPGDLLFLKQKWGMHIIGAESNERSRPLWTVEMRPRSMIVFGSEGHGVSAATLALCDEIAAIPMSADVPSVNVAVASAVFLYELRRRAGRGSGGASIP
jgi:tRNA G18 (ribose-2'-O)-methylase SpoU